MTPNHAEATEQAIAAAQMQAARFDAQPTGASKKCQACGLQGICPLLSWETSGEVF